MHRLFARLTFCAFLVLAGCTLMELRRENTETEKRVEAKIQEVKDLQGQQKALLEHQRSLLQELDNKQVTLNELDTKLDNLIKENAHVQAGNAIQQKKKEDLELQLRKYQEEIATLKNNGRLSSEEKAKKIKDLENQIKSYLEFMLTQ